MVVWQLFNHAAVKVDCIELEEKVATSMQSDETLVDYVSCNLKYS